MPVLRCSREFYDWVTTKAIKSGNPSSIILDRMMELPVEQPTEALQPQKKVHEPEDLVLLPGAKIRTRYKNLTAYGRKILAKAENPQT